MADKSESTGILASNMGDSLEEVKLVVKSEMRSSLTTTIEIDLHKDLSTYLAVFLTA